MRDTAAICTDTATKLGQVPMSLATLERIQAQLRDRVIALRERLECVLSPSRPNACKENPSSVGGISDGCPYGDAITHHCDNFGELVGYVEDILNRLQV